MVNLFIINKRCYRKFFSNNKEEVWKNFTYKQDKDANAFVYWIQKVM